MIGVARIFNAEVKRTVVTHPVADLFIRGVA